MKEGSPSILFCLLLLLILVGTGVYLTSLSGEFVWDDTHFIVENTFLRSPRYLPQILFGDVAAGSGQSYNYYRPLPVVSYLFDYTFWKLNPVGYHLSSILFHLLVAAAVFYLTFIFSRRPIFAAFAGLLYAVHPIHTETVAYISGRPDALAALFVLLGMIAYSKNIDSPRPGYLIGIMIFSGLALLSRENSVVLPGLLIAYHLTFRKKIRWPAFLVPAVMALGYGAIRLVLLGQPPAPTRLVQRIPGFFAAQAYYFRLLLLPLHLHQEYGFRLFSFSKPPVIAGIIFTTVLLAGVCRCLLRIYRTPRRAGNLSCRLFAFGILWYFIALLPVSGIYPIRAYLAEHWLYLPWIGLIWAAGAVIRPFCSRFRRPGLPVAVGTLIIASYGVLTVFQNLYFRDPLTFYERTVRYNPESARLYNNLGNIYYRRGRSRQAAAAYEKAIALEPAYPNPYNNLGNLYYQYGSLTKAEGLFQKAIEIHPGYAAVYNNLALIAFQRGEMEKGIDLLKTALRLQPRDADTLYNLGVASGRVANRADQIKYYRKALDLRPDSVRVRHALKRARAEEQSNQ